MFDRRVTEEYEAWLESRSGLSPITDPFILFKVGFNSGYEEGYEDGWDAGYEMHPANRNA